MMAADIRLLAVVQHEETPFYIERGIPPKKKIILPNTMLAGA
jgi:hypothetical protein